MLIVLALLRLLLHSLYLDLIDDADEKLAKEINKWEMSKHTKIEITFEQAIADYACLLLLLNNSIFLRMKLLYFILAQTNAHALITLIVWPIWLV